MKELTIKDLAYIMKQAKKKQSTEADFLSRCWYI